MFGPAHAACLAATRKDRLGYNPDKSTGTRAHVGALLATLASLATATAADKTAFLAPQEDQGPFGSCGGHGTSQMLAMAYGSAGKPLGFTASPGYTYRGARRLSTPATSASGPALTDSGIDPETLIAFLQTFGCVPIGFDSACPTSDGRYSDVETSNVNTDIQLDAEVSGRTRLTLTAHDVDVSGSIASIQAQVVPLLAAPGVAVGFGIFVDTAFENWDPSQGPLDGAANLNDTAGGGHWLPPSAFALDGSTGLYTLKNSWGSSFGIAGSIVVTDRRMQSMLSQAIAIQVS